MIKGVNRQVVEVQETDCAYFERILFFVKPEYASVSEGKIRERASLIANRTQSAPPTKRRRSAALRGLPYGAAFLAGCLLTLLLGALLR
jgi:hypothetical protein